MDTKERIITTMNNLTRHIPNFSFVVRQKELDQPVGAWKVVDSFSTRSVAKRTARQCEQQNPGAHFRVFSERW